MKKDPSLKASTRKTAQRARDCLAVFEKHELPPKTKYATDVKQADSFVVDAWDVMAAKGASLFEADAFLSDIRIDGDFAVAKAHNFWRRHGSNEEDSYHVHFVRVNDRWLIDISPWWMPWGRPLIERRKILAERYAR